MIKVLIDNVLYVEAATFERRCISCVSDVNKCLVIEHCVRNNMYHWVIKPSIKR